MKKAPLLIIGIALLFFAPVLAHAMVASTPLKIRPRYSPSLAPPAPSSSRGADSPASSNLHIHLNVL